MLTTTARWSSCAATSTSIAAYARQRVTWSRSIPSRSPPCGPRGGGRPPLDGRTRHRRRHTGPLDRPRDRPPRWPARLLGARLALGAGFPRRCDADSRWRDATKRPASTLRLWRPPQMGTHRAALSSRGQTPLTPLRNRPHCHQPNTSTRCSIATTTTLSHASGKTAPRRCWTRCPAWPSASACAWLW